MHGLVPAVTRHVVSRHLHQILKSSAVESWVYTDFSARRRVSTDSSTASKFVARRAVSVPEQDAGQTHLCDRQTSERKPRFDVHSFQRTCRTHVVDISNSQFLLLSNQLGPGERINPLRRFVGRPPKPQTETHISFDDRVELIGYDIPTEVQRGSGS